MLSSKEHGRRYAEHKRDSVLPRSIIIHIRMLLFYFGKSLPASLPPSLSPSLSRNAFQPLNKMQDWSKTYRLVLVN